jgi:hypothetical protein
MSALSKEGKTYLFLKHSVPLTIIELNNANSYIHEIWPFS